MRNATCRKGAKRLISLLLALLCLGASAGLAASPGSVPLGAMLYDNAEQLQGIAVVNGSLYMLTEDNLLRWRPGDAAPTALTADQPFDIDLEQALSATLLEDGGSLWWFEPGTGRLQLLAPEGDGYRAGKPVRLNWRMFTDDGKRWW
ncbi:MAG: hypothetical protein GX916_11855 [Clostridiales bacterium]|nr:hypothetical protein [Clostridiales bacterium]